MYIAYILTLTNNGERKMKKGDLVKMKNSGFQYKIIKVTNYFVTLKDPNSYDYPIDQTIEEFNKRFCKA